jgi:hypothetical protein
MIMIAGPTTEIIVGPKTETAMRMKTEIITIDTNGTAAKIAPTEFGPGNSIASTKISID